MRECAEALFRATKYKVLPNSAMLHALKKLFFCGIFLEN